MRRKGLRLLEFKIPVHIHIFVYSMRNAMLGIKMENHFSNANLVSRSLETVTTTIFLFMLDAPKHSRGIFFFFAKMERNLM